MTTNPDKKIIKAAMKLTAFKYGSKTGKIKKKHINRFKKDQEKNK